MKRGKYLEKSHMRAKKRIASKSPTRQAKSHVVKKSYLGKLLIAFVFIILCFSITAVVYGRGPLVPFFAATTGIYRVDISVDDGSIVQEVPNINVISSGSSCMSDCLKDKKLSTSACGSKCATPTPVAPPKAPATNAGNCSSLKCNSNQTKDTVPGSSTICICKDKPAPIAPPPTLQSCRDKCRAQGKPDSVCTNECASTVTKPAAAPAANQTTVVVPPPAESNKKACGSGAGAIGSSNTVRGDVKNGKDTIYRCNDGLYVAVCGTGAPGILDCNDNDYNAITLKPTYQIIDDANKAKDKAKTDEEKAAIKIEFNCNKNGTIYATGNEIVNPNGSKEVCQAGKTVPAEDYYKQKQAECKDYWGADNVCHARIECSYKTPKCENGFFKTCKVIDNKIVETVTNLACGGSKEEAGIDCGKISCNPTTQTVEHISGSTSGKCVCKDKPVVETGDTNSSDSDKEYGSPLSCEDGKPKDTVCKPVNGHYVRVDQVIPQPGTVEGGERVDDVKLCKHGGYIELGRYICKYTDEQTQVIHAAGDSCFFTFGLTCQSKQCKWASKIPEKVDGFYCADDNGNVPGENTASTNTVTGDTSQTTNNAGSTVDSPNNPDSSRNNDNQIKNGYRCQNPGKPDPECETGYCGGNFFVSSCEEAPPYVLNPPALGTVEGGERVDDVKLCNHGGYIYLGKYVCKYADSQSQTIFKEGDSCLFGFGAVCHTGKCQWASKIPGKLDGLYCADENGKVPGENTAK